MKSLDGRFTRRQIIAAAGGVATLALFDPRAVHAGRAPVPRDDRKAPSLSETDPHHLAWVWQFRHDGKAEQIRDTLAAFGLGVALKTHDGSNWMSKYDPTREAVDGAARVEALANFFERGGVPFHAWAVAKGRDPKKEAELAADVLAAGARSLFIDLEGHPGFWVGTAAAAEQYGEALRRRQPSARLSTSIDPRPWEIDRIPLKEFAAFTDEISPQVYWQSFATAANVRKYRTAGEQIEVADITPRFVIAAAARRLADFDRPLHPIGDGTVATPSAWSDFIDESYTAEARSVSVWRFGVADPAIWELLKETPPRRLTYVVQAGDTLGAIAARWGTTVDALVGANGIANPNLITVGTTLRAPRGAVVTAPAAPAAPSAPAAPTASTAPTVASYVVQPGDTLSQIAERLGTTVDALMTANGITDARYLRIGATLAVPGRATPPPAASPLAARARSYTVQPGDTLSQIAERFDTTTLKLARANGITDTHRVRIGTVLALP